MKLIVGLGNVGDKYKDTRHNVGFEVVDLISEKLGVKGEFREDKQNNCEILLTEFENQKLVLIKPTTFMNLSGMAVLKVKNYYKIDENDTVVIYDDMDLELGKIQIKKSGSSGGHHGLESILQVLPQNNFTRVRLGIGKDELLSATAKTGADYVLAKFSKKERKVINESIKNASEAVLCVTAKTLEYCMNLYNKKISNNMPMELDAS